MLISLLKTKKVKKENIVSNRYRKMLTQQFSNKYTAESEKRVIEKYKKNITPARTENVLRGTDKIITPLREECMCYEEMIKY